MSTTAKPRFSSGLQFTRNEAQNVGSSIVDDNNRASSAATTLPALTEEEQLLRSAAALRRSITEELQPRLDAAGEALRNLHRRVSAMRPQLPCSAFFTFQTMCVRLRRRVVLFEDVSVQRLLKEAATAAVAAGACASTDAARWSKSNRRPALSTFLDLQLFLCLACARGQQQQATVRAVTSSSTTSPSCAAAGGAAEDVSVAIQRHLVLLWRDRQHGQLSDAFLLRFYLLKDVLYGWGTGWHLPPPCADPAEEGEGTHAKGEASVDGGETVRCPSLAWDGLSNLERLLSFNSLCSQHLTESVVAALDAALQGEFADVWSVLAAAL